MPLKSCNHSQYIITLPTEKFVRLVPKLPELTSKFLLYDSGCQPFHRSRKVFKIWAKLGLFLFYFWSFQINVKSGHLVSGIGVRTHDLLIMSLLTLPLDQGCLPPKCVSDIISAALPFLLLIPQLMRFSRQ